MRRRDSSLLAGRTVVEVGLFTRDESLTYLRSKLSQTIVMEDALGLSADLGHLPLALAQCAAYISDLGLTCAEYRRRFNDWRLSRLVPGRQTLPDEQRDTIDSTWSLSMEAVNSVRPVGLALPLLRLIATANVNQIHIKLFGFRPVVEYLNSQWSGSGGVSTEDIRDGLHNLRRFNLVTIGEDDYVGSHPLLRRVVREGVAESHMQELSSVVYWWVQEMILDIKWEHLTGHWLGNKMDAAVERAGMRAGFWIGTKLRRLMKGPDS
jgi:hypothetical protein